jgi:hypothetical protein
MMTTSPDLALAAHEGLTPLRLANDEMRADFARLAATARTGLDTAQLDEDLEAAVARFRRHHDGEDALLWPLLRGRVSLREAGLDDLRTQRGCIDRVMADATDDPRPAAERAGLLADLCRLVTGYLDALEQRVFPLVSQVMAVAGDPTSDNARGAGAAGWTLESRLRAIAYGWFPLVGNRAAARTSAAVG